MTFAYPHLLYLLIVPALLLVLAYVVGRNRSRKWERLVAPELRKELVNPPNHARRLTALLTGMIGLALLITAMARPQWGEREVQEFSRGRNLLIAIDVSRSMLTRDVQPSRLEQARTAAFDLLDALPEDKIGLIVFSGEASLVVPLTHDHNAIRETLEQANYGWINYGGTNFNDVISLALKTFGRTEGTNALVLISDGETTEPLSPSLADDAKTAKLIVIAAGVGTATGDTIPDKTSPDGFFRDRSGKMVVSKLDSASLELLAKDTGGQYAAISSGNTLNRMVKEVSKKLDERENATSTRKIAMERYAPFLGAGMFLTALALMLSAQWTNRTARGKTAAMTLLLLGLSLLAPEGRANTPEMAHPDAPAPRPLFGNGEKTTDAIPDVPIPEDLPLEMKSWLAFQNGYNNFKQGKFAEAASAFSQALLSEDKKVQTEAHYNLANSLVEKNLKLLKGKEAEKIFSDEKALKAMEDSLREAIRHYEDTLKKEASHLNAQTNKKIVEEIIKKLKEEKQKQDQKKDNQQQDQNQQKNDQQKDNQQDQNQQKDNQQDQNQQDQNQQKNDQQKDNQQDQNQQKNDQQKNGQQDQNQQKNDQQKNGQQDQNQQKNDQQKNGQQDQNQQKNDQQKNGQQDQNQQKNDQQKNGQQDQNQQKNDQQKNGQQDQNQQKNDQQKDGQQDQNQQKNDQQKDGQQDQPADQSGEQAKAGSPSGKPGEAGDVEGRRIPVGEEEGKAPEDTPEEQALKILKERSDLEKGNPMPQYRPGNTPSKDW